MPAESSYRSKKEMVPVSIPSQGSYVTNQHSHKGKKKDSHYYDYASRHFDKYSQSREKWESLQRKITNLRNENEELKKSLFDWYIPSLQLN